MHRPSPGGPHIFIGLKYSGASSGSRPYFPVVKFIGLQYSVLAITDSLQADSPLIQDTLLCQPPHYIVSSLIALPPSMKKGFLVLTISLLPHHKQALRGTTTHTQTHKQTHRYCDLQTQPANRRLEWKGNRFITYANNSGFLRKFRLNLF